MFTAIIDHAKSSSDLKYAKKKTLTQRERFLAEIDGLTPWNKLHTLLEPFYMKAEGAGRPPMGLERTLRMWHNKLRFVGRRHRKCNLRQPSHSRFRWHRSSTRVGS